MKNWMYELACHYESMRQKYPDDRLLVLFDIDGTILDMRYTIHYLLASYDRAFNTDYFNDIRITDITFHEDNIGEWLKSMHISPKDTRHIIQWYNSNRWSLWSIFEANRPFPGVLEVIRWLQLQPNTHVGLNTSRAEILREDTLDSLNRLGREYRVVFHDSLLKMRPSSKHADEAGNKVSSIIEYKSMGYRVIAMVDNEIVNLEKISNADIDREILLLHARTLYRQTGIEQHNVEACHGNVYDLTELIPRRSLPRHIQFVWNNINNDASLRRFTGSNVQWGDITGTSFGLVGKSLQHIKDNAVDFQFMRYLDELQTAGKSVRLSLQSVLPHADLIMDLLVDSEIDSRQLWINARIDSLNRDSFMFVADVFPEAIVECPVDFLIPIMLTTPEKAEHILDTYICWGVNRFSLSWRSPRVKRALTILEKLGFETTVYDVNNLEEFLQAVLFQPTAIVSDFNYPKWDNAYYRGGQDSARSA